MGIVYEVFDTQKQAKVALKTLPDLAPSRLYLFKQEFRGLCRVSHPNLVTLHELFCEEDRWYFTMELVEGLWFSKYIRSETIGENAETQSLARFEPGPDTEKATVPTTATAPAPCDYVRLRAALRQLTEGVAALHLAGKLHCDLKPSNVLVTPEGRVVILDFGLVAEWTGNSNTASSHGLPRGTMNYMSPEQAAGEDLGPASDWYSVGVMLYEALTGTLPFRGTRMQVFLDKQREDPPSPSMAAGGIPTALAQLCERLLKRDPTQRPDAGEILGVLGNTTLTDVAPSPIGEASCESPLFVGREAELEALDSALTLSQRGRTVMMLLHGRSGIGKSALATHFLNLVSVRPQTVILTGRCYEQELVPYKALDSLVDSLSRYLGRQPAETAAELIPRDISALVKVFPALAHAPCVARAHGRQLEGVDHRELRRRAFGALRELLGRLGDRAELVLFIDDLQWGDAESALLLKDVLLPPDGPRLLLICAYRSEHVERSACLQALLHPRESEAMQPETREIRLEPLNDNESRMLAERLLGDTGVTAPLAAIVARESAGSPYFLRELAHRAKAPAPPDDSTDELTINSAIWARVKALTADARRLLEVICVAGQPLHLADAYPAAGLRSRNEKSLVYLRNHHLVTSTGSSNTDDVEVYHDRIREAVLAHIWPANKVDYHRRLASTLEVSGGADDETIAIHYDAAGEQKNARKYYYTAGEKAAAALAFDHAAGLFQRTLELSRAAGDEPAQLRSKLAEALANAGRSAEAAVLYQQAADNAAEADRLQFNWQAAYHFTASGHIVEGKAAFARILAQVGLRLPSGPSEAIRTILWCRLRLMARGLRFKPRSESEVSKMELQRADMAWSAATGLTMSDTYSAAALACRALLLALQTREPYRIARALLLEALTRGWTPRERRTAIALIDQARPHVESSGSAYLKGLQELALASFFFSSGQWRKGLAHATNAERVFCGECRLAWWELATSRSTILFCLVLLGDIPMLAELCTAWLKDARGRGDRYSATTIGVYAEPGRRLAMDSAESALQILQESLAEWSGEAFHVQQTLGFVMRGYLAVYQQQAREVWDSIQKHWPVLERHHILRGELIRISLLEMRMRVALTAVLEGADSEPLLASAQRDAAALEKEHARYAVSHSYSGKACLAEFRGDRAGAVRLLKQAIAIYDEVELRPFAEAARRALGILIGGERGDDMVRQAEASLRAHGYRNPARHTAMYIPIRAVWGPARHQEGT